MKSLLIALGAPLALLGLLGLGGCGSDDDADNPSGSASGSGATGSGGDSAGPGGSGSGGSGNGGAGPSCLDTFTGPVPPQYDQFGPTYGQHCLGTNHQDVAGVEKVVFLGDSITNGTPPTAAAEYYRARLGETLAAKFGDVELVSCAENGARVDDLIPTQIPNCFPAPEQKKTLVVMTMGGNDLANWAENKLPADQASAEAEKVAAEFQKAIEMLIDPALTPGGVFVVFANVYEFTDGTGDLDSCPAAGLFGLSGDYLDGAVALAHLDELYMKTAVDTGTDMILLLEHFCGHGYRNDDPEAPCYLGPDTPRWFDLTCIHPNPAGHQELANMFQAVVDE